MTLQELFDRAQWWKKDIEIVVIVGDQGYKVKYIAATQTKLYIKIEEDNAIHIH
jgi:hypothetical protein